MQYACGCCCQTTITKSVPLDKIQDVNIISDCCGDCCGCSEGPNQPYKMYVQTAGQSNPVAELSIFCIENVADFRAKVLAAKRALGGSSSSTAAGVGKEGEGGGGLVPAAGDNTVLLRVLERIEAAINNGVNELKAQRRG
jgi:hypothetical protein